MKIFNIENQVVNKSLENAFNLMYNTDNNIVGSSVSQIIDWQTENWHQRKKFLERRDTITIYVADLPDLYAANLDNNQKHIKILMVSKISLHNEKEYILRTKYKVINLVPVMQTIINTLHLVKTKCKIHLKKINDTTTTLNVRCKISVFLPYATEIEDYIYGFISSVFTRITNVLS